MLLSSEYDILSSVLLGVEDLTLDVVERVVTTAHGENDLAWARSGDAQKAAPSSRRPV